VTHFATAVFVPNDVAQDEDSVEAYLNDVLEPFNENMPVEPYQSKCYCVGGAALQDVNAQVEREFPMQALRQQFRTDVGEDKYNDINWVFSDESDELWETYIGPRRKRQEELLKAHPLVHSPDEQCYECGGSGFVTSTYNQNAQWDFWEVGGRWYGAWNARNDRNVFPGNAAFASELLDSDEPVAFILNGEWHQRGDVGWFGQVDKHSKDKASWQEEWHGALRENADSLVVFCDLHI
jgi:hypothetical protein